MFSTRIAYITKQGTRYQLLVADADGYDPQTIVTSNEPMLSPRWSPDGTRLAYVSFENKKPVVYVQYLATGRAPGGRQFPRQQQRARVVARRPQARGDADQGRRLADLPDERRRQQRAARDESPAHRHRGDVHARRRVAAVHLRPRRQPQIYRLQRSAAARSSGSRSTAATTSRRGRCPTARASCSCAATAGASRSRSQDFATRQVQVLTAGPHDESPSVAPNGKLILYANEAGGRGTLAAVSSDGRVKQRLVSPAADVREPAWGPFPRPDSMPFCPFRRRDPRALANLRRRLHEKIPRRRRHGGACSPAARRRRTSAPVDDKSAAAARRGRRRRRAPRPAAATRPAAQRRQRAPARNPLKDPNNILSKRSIYFDFDSFVVEDEYKPMVEAHAKYLAAQPDARVTLQGNTDERGSREYNIALGQKRADAVKRDDDADGRAGRPDRDGQLRQGKAARAKATTKRRGRRTAASTSSTPASDGTRHRQCVAPRRSSRSRLSASRRSRTRRRCSTTRRRASASPRPTLRIDQLKRTSTTRLARSSSSEERRAGRPLPTTSRR